jgi:tRNA1(Val) A37 N6-methylase TrmN6
MTTKEQIKNTGATFTPKELADYLSVKILTYLGKGKIKILDPACGEGELLVSIGVKLSSANIQFSLTGFDESLQYLNNAKSRMEQLGPGLSELIYGDFLKAVTLTEDQMALDFTPMDEPNSVNQTFDVVIANPPYVRTQILGTDHAQELAKKFNLKGRVDLYYPFIIAMTESLKEGGVLGVITSNRYLSTKSGESVRKYLSENYEILEVIDLGDTKIFDAAVLPAIFIGRKSRLKKPSPAKFLKIYEELNGYKGALVSVKDVFEVLSNEKPGYFTTGAKRYKKSEGVLKYNISSTSIWEMYSGSESQWVSGIDSAAKYRVEDLFKVRVGIKTTADKVFINERWDDLGQDKPEDELLKELISQENIEPWSMSDSLKLKVLYPHYSTNGVKQTIEIEDYPKTMKYLLLHKNKLMSRKYLIEAGRKWYEIWVPHRPEYWSFPKLVFPDISSYPRFYFDIEGKIVNGNCYWIVGMNDNDSEKLLLIQGIANSKLMTKYHDLVFNNKLYSGRRRYFTQYVEKYPLPDFNSPAAKEIIEVVKKLNQTTNTESTKEFERKLEIKVAESFDVEPVFNLD